MLELSAELAEGIGETPLVVYGVDMTVPVARRWANQLNENSKQFAFAAEIPEANHNLQEAWADGIGGFGGMFLLDRDQTEREREREELTAEAIGRTGAPVFSVETSGDEPFRAALLGGHARRPGLREHRRAAGHRPAPGPPDPGLQEEAGRPLMKAMVLAAGLGTRLRPITYLGPEADGPGAQSAGHGAHHHPAEESRFHRVIANLHWFPDTIRSHFGDGSEFGVQLEYSPEDALLGTAGGVRNAAHFFEDSFLVISGDALTDIDLAAMREFPRESRRRRHAGHEEGR